MKVELRSTVSGSIAEVDPQRSIRKMGPIIVDKDSTVVILVILISDIPVDPFRQPNDGLEFGRREAHRITIDPIAVNGKPRYREGIRNERSHSATLAIVLVYPICGK